MYLTSVVVMIYLLVFIYRNRNASLEAVEKGDLSAPRILFSLRGEPVSLYLRIGLCIFAAMTIVFAVCRGIEVAITGKEHLRIIVYTFSKILFIIVQPIFLLWLHRLVVLANVRAFSFLLLHLLTVNLCIWVSSAVEKVSSTMIDETHNSKAITHEKLVKISGYFLPAIPEYCAIAAAVIYEMCQRVGQLKQVEAHHHRSEEPGDKRGVRHYFGLMFGVALPILVLIVVLFLENGGTKIHNSRYIIHLTEMSGIHLIALVLCVTGILLVRRLKFSVNFAKNNLDEKLLLITFFLTLNFFVASIVLCVVYLSSDKTTGGEEAYLYAHLFSLLLELLQVIVQTYFIHDMFYRCCHHEAYKQSKPGRLVIAILSSLNFSLWMIYSFQVKHNSVLFKKGGESINGADLKGLYIFTRVVLPMVMLFRYHSSVCLAISFVRIYEDEVTRYESSLRWIKQGTTKDFLQKQRLSLADIWGMADGISQISEVVVPPKPTSDGSETVQSSHFSTTVDGDVFKSQEELVRTQERGRRDTQMNWELAKLRVAKSERGHRMAESKLQKQRILHNPFIACMSDKGAGGKVYPKGLEPFTNSLNVVKEEVPAKQLTPQPIRRDTQTNWEMARLRVAASEAVHRQAKLKLDQRQLGDHSPQNGLKDIVEE
ncbi:unnamed protein product [Dicrocoelium dendriticum]|nr:unnamed protein product [Dicrocoelium dendriticum]